MKIVKISFYMLGVIYFIIKYKQMMYSRPKKNHETVAIFLVVIDVETNGGHRCLWIKVLYYDISII